MSRGGLTRPVGDDADDLERWETYQAIDEITVSEPESDDTGLVDADGTPLRRERRPIGFLADL